MTTLIPIALSLLLQSTALLLLGLLVLRLARRRGPAVQSLVGRATLTGVALALLLAAPLAGHVRPVWHVTLPVSPPAPNNGGARVDELTPPPPNETSAASPPTPARRAPAAGTTGRKINEESRLLDGASLDRAPLAEQPSDSSGKTDHHLPNPPSPLGRVAARGGVGLLTAAWGLGAALLLLWLAFCQCHLTRLRRLASPITIGPAAATLAALTPRPPSLLTHPSIRSPFLAGVRRPAIFLPTGYEAEFNLTALRAILAHELAHLARRDTTWTLAARLLTALLWPQPLLWVLCRRLEQSSEEACDQAVLAQDCPPRAYADCLLTLAERHPLGRRERALGVGVAPFRSSLGRRIGRILDKRTHAMSAVTLRLRLTAAALTVAAALGGVLLVSSTPARVSAAPVPTSSQTGKSSLVGTWLCTHDDGTGNVLIFSPASQFEQIGPWPGESTAVGHSYGRNQAVYHSYGPYVIEGPKLRYTDTRLWVEGEKPLKADDPYVHAMDYSLLGDTLTLRLKGKWVNVYHRVPAYTKAMLGIKPSASSEAVTQSQELSEARYLAGLTPVQGPGIVVTLRDGKKPLRRDMPPGFAPPSIIHDSDINAVVNELKAAGAEAIAVNGQRLVATSSVRTAGATVLINFVPTAPPYVIKAIGDPKTLASAMSLPGGVASQIKAFDPAMFSVKESNALMLPAYSGGSQPRYAKSVSAASLAAARQGMADTAQLQALLRQRERLQEELRDLNAQADAFTLQSKIRRAEVAQGLRGATSLRPHGTSAHSQIEIKMQALGSQIVAAQKDLRRKAATMPPSSPAVIAARRKVQTLEQAYREQPIREKQAFVKAVRQYTRQQVTAVTLAKAEDATARQLLNIQKQRHQLRATIASLDAQTSQHNAPAPGR